MAAAPSPSADRDWMFCPATGALMELDAARNVAWCPVSGHEQDLDELADVRIVSTTDMDDYRRRYKLEPIAAPTSDADAAAAAAAAGAPRNRSTVDEPCVKCGHVGLDFYTMQLRSADEGSTVFYECRACGHKWNQNN